MTRWIHLMVTRIIFLSILVLMLGCGNQEQVSQLATTEFFTQGFNPPKLDFLIVQYDGSSMFDNRVQFVNQAKALFTKLDAVPQDYRLGIITADMDYARGALQPRGNPTIITKTVGTLNDRVTIFGNILSNIINLQTGPRDKGFQAALTALQSTFIPRAAVPLVMVFISDKDDKSTGVTQDYVDSFKAIKNNQSELLKIYSVNYFPLTGPRNRSNRCATFDNADIDSPGFEDRYFSLARAITPSLGENVVADLCGNFSTNIDLSGLRLTELPRRFVLNERPQVSSLQVSVVRQSTGETFQITWRYDSATNAIVFTSAPPEGTTIQVTYQRG